MPYDPLMRWEWEGGAVAPLGDPRGAEARERGPQPRRSMSRRAGERARRGQHQDPGDAGERRSRRDDAAHAGGDCERSAQADADDERRLHPARE